jgi:hypothetical protein
MAPKIRQTVSELMIYDADDEDSSDEAKEFLSTYDIGAWTVAAAGCHGVGDLSKTLQDFCHIEQLSFCTHSHPGLVSFARGNLETANLKTVIVPRTLFRAAGRLLFMGCQTARSRVGEDFLVAAGRHFFVGKGGVVGGATTATIGFSSGTRLPIVDWLSRDCEVGKLILIQLDASGKVIGSRNISYSSASRRRGRSQERRGCTAHPATVAVERLQDPGGRHLAQRRHRCFGQVPAENQKSD